MIIDIMINFLIGLGILIGILILNEFEKLMLGVILLLYVGFITIVLAGIGMIFRAILGF